MVDESEIGATRLGVDVGATRIKAGIVRPDGSIERQGAVWLGEADRTEAGLLDRIEALVRELDPDGRATEVGVGIPGAVRWPEGVVTSSPNFPHWSDFTLRERLSERVGRRVAVDNDANAVILGACRLDGYAGVSSLVGLTLGTGVGGAVILDGALYRGRDGMAGEIGHITVDPNGPACGCGGRGCLEMYASRVGFRQACLEASIDGVDPDDPRLPEVLAGLARSGNPKAVRCFDRAGRALGQVIAGLANTLNMERVLLAGGVAPTFELMREAAWPEIRARSYVAVHHDLKVSVISSGDAAGVVGSALLSAPEG